MTHSLPQGYRLQAGSTAERSLLVKFMQHTYEELYPGGNFSHLTQTVEQYCSSDTPIWWVEHGAAENTRLSGRANRQPVGCLWLGNAIAQATGERYAYIFLLYVMPDHRRQGIGAALIDCAEDWAKARGDRQIGLQVFETNQPALNLYRSLGYQTESLGMVKPL